LNSCADLPRQLVKLHVTITLGQKVTPEMKLLEKMRAILITDSNTPILGPFARKVHSIVGDIPENEATAQIRPWNLKFSADVHYPNESAEWMMEYASNVLPEFDFDRFNQWIDTLTTLKDCLKAPLCQEPKVVMKENVVVNGECLIAPAPVKTAPTPKGGSKVRSVSSKSPVVKSTSPTRNLVHPCCCYMSTKITCRSAKHDTQFGQSPPTRDQGLVTQNPITKEWWRNSTLAKRKQAPVKSGQPQTPVKPGRPMKAK